MTDRQERRSSTLSDSDIERIGAVFDRRMDSLFEVIGYDTSTHESRSSIRKDHEFVRGLRKAKVKVVGAFLAGVGGSIALWFWNIFGGKPPHG